MLSSVSALWQCQEAVAAAAKLEKYLEDVDVQAFAACMASQTLPSDSPALSSSETYIDGLRILVEAFAGTVTVLSRGDTSFLSFGVLILDLHSVLGGASFHLEDDTQAAARMDASVCALLTSVFGDNTPFSEASGIIGGIPAGTGAYSSMLMRVSCMHVVLHFTHVQFTCVCRVFHLMLQIRRIQILRGYWWEMYIAGHLRQAQMVAQFSVRSFLPWRSPGSSVASKKAKPES